MLQTRPCSHKLSMFYKSQVELAFCLCTGCHLLERTKTKILVLMRVVLRLIWGLLPFLDICPGQHMKSICSRQQVSVCKSLLLSNVGVDSLDSTGSLNNRVRWLTFKPMALSLASLKLCFLLAIQPLMDKLRLLCQTCVPKGPHASAVLKRWCSNLCRLGVYGHDWHAVACTLAQVISRILDL